jgi:hypothetical protein
MENKSLPLQTASLQQNIRGKFNPVKKLSVKVKTCYQAACVTSLHSANLINVKLELTSVFAKELRPTAIAIHTLIAKKVTIAITSTTGLSNLDVRPT